MRSAFNLRGDQCCYIMLKDEIIHFILSIIAGTVVGYFTSNWWAIPVALISGFFIDADHLIDYFIYRRDRFNLAEFLSGKTFDLSGKVYTLFHGFEYSVILVILGIVIPDLSWLFFSLALSNLFHLVYDTISNKPIWPAYFLIYRATKNFNHKLLDFKCQK